jgi:serine/threonine-protein kinase
LSLREQLQAALGSAYALDRELAGGGMSRVFVATETALGRKVVVKVLHPELAAEITVERFSREIKLVAKLQQANIVPLLTTGHTGDVPFYTMPFVEGLSLRQRLSDTGRLPISEVVGILRDVARALAYAHDAGVVHRDIKPENVLISGGAAVVTDFGIAKAVTVSRTHTTAASPTLTQAGAGIGTPAYMPPEQATGDPTIDHRADIYAFGCLAYELLAGHPPFRETSVHELMAAHMTRTPVALGSLRGDTPPRLVHLVMRCLEKMPDERPQQARELLETLDTVATPGELAPSHPRGRTMRVGILVAGIAAIVAVTWFGLSRGGSAAPAGPPGVAVLPFVNVGGDSAQEYLADGLSDELATAVGRIPGLRLAARSGAYRYRGKRDVDVREVGTTLNVAYVVQGTVRQKGDSLQVSAQLTDAKSGSEIWSQPFNATKKDVFRTQDQIAGAITSALASRVRAPAATTVAAPTRPSDAPRGTTNVEAYDLYLRAEFLLNRRQVAPAAEMFRNAIKADPEYAQAYAGLSQTLALTPYYASVPNDSVEAQVSAAAQQALKRDSTLAEARMAIALMHLHAWRWAEAKAAFERAVAADPNDVQTHFQFGRYYFYLGDDANALREWATAKQLDPFSAIASAWTAQLLAFQGKVPEAVREMGRAVEYDSTAGVIKQMAGRVYSIAGDRARAIALADKMPDLPPWNGMTAYDHAFAGDRAGAEARVRRIEALPASLWFRNTGLAFGYLGLRDTARALAALEQATDRRETWATFNRVSDPIFDPIRKSARWAALLKRAQLEQTPGALR